MYGYRCANDNYCRFDNLTTAGQTCGNGKFDEGEECDNDFEDNTDGCTNQCKKGDDFECANTVDSLSACTPVVCGDGLVVGIDICDDVSNDGIGCEKGCAGSAPTYICGNNLAKTPNSYCSTSCGNGSVEGDEFCDDKNTNSTDGCNNCVE